MKKLTIFCIALIIVFVAGCKKKEGAPVTTSATTPVAPVQAQSTSKQAPAPAAPPFVEIPPPAAHPMIDVRDGNK